MNVMFRLLVLTVLLINYNSFSQETWIVPDEVNKLENPLNTTLEEIQLGKKLYTSLCVVCHGTEGKGDGIAAAGLNPKPTDFNSYEFHKQSNGAIFWKLSKGKGVMAPYEGMLSEKDRWAIVSYLKSLKPKKKIEIKTSQVENDKIKNTFLFTQLINTQTTQVLPKKKSEFTIQHRFGATKLNQDFINDFFGTDLGANLRFAFAKSFSDRLYAEISRTKYRKTYDLGIKYLVLQQTNDNKTPFNLAMYVDVGVRTDKFPEILDGSTFVDGSEFSYVFAHRLSYNSQLIISRKFSNIFSMQFAPVLIWHNLVDEDAKNLNFAVPIGGRVKLSYKSALLFELVPKVIAKNKRMPISLAWEIASSSAHAFQLLLTNTDRIVEQTIYSNEVMDYTTGKFILGFNIKRVF